MSLATIATIASNSTPAQECPTFPEIGFGEEYFQRLFAFRRAWLGVEVPGRAALGLANKLLSHLPLPGEQAGMKSDSN